MVEALENNSSAMLVTLLLGGTLWWATSWLHDHRARRALRVSIAVLCFPILYLGHPFLYYPSWALLFIYAAQGSWFAAGMFAAVWVALVLFALRLLNQKNAGH